MFLKTLKDWRQCVDSAHTINSARSVQAYLHVLEDSRRGPCPVGLGGRRGGRGVRRVLGPGDAESEIL